MAEEIFMDVPAVQNMARRFDQMNQVLTAANRAIQAAITVLKTTAFVGLVGGYAVAQYMEQIQPRIQETAEKCGELGQDLRSSAEAYERGDAIGATRFH
jgi:uncharacterized protein YukE